MARGGRRPGAGRPRTRDPGEYRTRALELHQRQDAWLREEAQRRGCSVSALVRELVDEAAAEA